MTIEWIELILQLAMATLFGGLVGYQREKAEKPAGLRTHILVCLGAALIMQVSVYPFKGVENADTTRIAAGVVIGIGFLGAGTIIRQGSAVRGLTTAASVWVTAGVGLAVGIGFYIPAVATTVLIIVALTILKQIDVRISGDLKTISLVSKDKPGQLGKVGFVLGELNVNIKSIELERGEETGICGIRLVVDARSDVSSDTIVDKLSELEGISSTIWES